MLEALKNGCWVTPERLRNYPLIIGVMGILALVVLWSTGQTAMTDLLGRPIGTDFSGFWTAGRMILDGRPADIFDPVTHVTFQRELYQRADIQVYGWHYPPFLMPVAAAVASLSYIVGFIVWQLSTLAMFVAMLRSVLPGQATLVTIAAIGFPATFSTLGHGHNAFLTAALLGSGLLLLDRRPVIAGVLFGLLAYKPQFGILLPLVLVLLGQWTAIASASVTVIVMAVGVTLAYGFDIWPAFLAGTEFTRTAVLELGATGWSKIQSVFSAARSFGLPVSVAYFAQAISTLIVLGALSALCIARCDSRLIAAATASGALLATPYCLDYDMTILGVAIAFSVAHALDRGFAPYQATLLVAVWAVPLIARSGMAVTGFPIGVVVMAIFFGSIVHRALAEAPNGSILDHWRVARG